MRVGITGASGLIGSALALFLTGKGHEVLRLVRAQQSGPAERDEGAPRLTTISWDPQSGEVDRKALSSADALVHLAGRNIAVRWTKRHRQEIWDSRVPATEKLCRTLASMPNPSRTLITASGIGYYGDGGDKIMTEADAPGTGFLAEVSKAWEAATKPAEQAGIRLARLRIGMVLSARGGALKKMLLPAKLGLLGPAGSGRQWMSWIALEDLVGLIVHLLNTTTARGVFNAVSPNPVQQAEFSHTLGRVLHRPSFLPMPVFAVRVLFGQMGCETLLASTRAVPAAAVASGFEFRHPILEEALRAELASNG
ncbi:MAG: TIGR01777 family protein [Verrucomicrobia bacterium]|nr:MAG: TIGR01777 family protein [Verrucomicrobiota bacterium]